MAKGAKDTLKDNYKDMGLVFIGPIIGLPQSLLDAFNPLKDRGLSIEGVDIWEGQNIKKNLWTILGLTILPGSDKRRINFANKFNEPILFENIIEKIAKMRERGVKHIILGGMSGGFVYASRLAQHPIEDELNKYGHIQSHIKGLLGISPLTFYPKHVTQKGADLELIPAHIPTILIWGDNDTIIPEGTINQSHKISKKSDIIRHTVIKGSDVGEKDGVVRHQFFGGEDFVKPLKNVFWNKKAEKLALDNIEDFIKDLKNNTKNNA